MQMVERYGVGMFTISGVEYGHSVLVLPERVIFWNGELTPKALADVTPQEAELLLIGTGVRITVLPPELRAHFRERGIGVEVMDTGAACRTYNVLAGEGRKVAAALMLLPAGA